MPLTKMFDQVGPLARCVDDLVLFDAVAAADPSPLRETRPGALRIGVPTRYFWDGLDAGVERVGREALARLRADGHTIVDVEPSAIVARTPELAASVIAYQARDSITAFLERSRAPVSFEEMLAAAGPNVRSLMTAMALPPNRPSDDAFRRTQEGLAALRRDVRRLFEEGGLGVLVFPVAMAPPPRVGEETDVLIDGRSVPLATALARNTALGSCLGAPSLVLPAGLDPRGLPVGLEFLALPGRDRDLLSLGKALERALGPVPAPAIVDR